MNESPRQTSLLLLGVAFLLAGVACNGSGPIRVGAKPFPEQRILAEMTAELLSKSGYGTRPVRNCDDSYDCQRQLQSGRMDLMVEYTGTALHLMGEQVPGGRGQMEYLREIYGPLGLDWLAPLGFDNDYRWMMPADRAASLGVETLEDLAELDRPITVACGPEYILRPRDGLEATARRYGIELARQPVVERDAAKRYRAAREGEADLVVGYGTDGMLKQTGMTHLEDSLDFMPSYDAAMLARKDVLDEQPGLKKVLAKLEGKLDAKTMRNLNYAVSVRGRSPASVAHEFLVEHDLVESAGEASARKPVVTIARSTNSPHPETSSRTLQAVRTIFPGSVVKYKDVDEPAESVSSGQTRMALMGADHFFERKRDGLERRRGIEAVAVAGSRAVYVLAPTDADSQVDPLAGDIGLVDSMLGDHIRRAADLEPTLRAPADRLAQALADGEIDRAIIPAPPGGAKISTLLRNHDFTVGGLPRGALSGAQLSLPFLRPARLSSAETGAEPVETVSMQVLLAGPAGKGHHLSQANGPAAALEARGAPFTIDQAETLADALGIQQAPDPSLPATIAARGGQGAGDGQSEYVQNIVDASLNFLVIVFLVWLVYLTAFAKGREDG